MSIAATSPLPSFRLFFHESPDPCGNRGTSSHRLRRYSQQRGGGCACSIDTGTAFSFTRNSISVVSRIILANEPTNGDRLSSIKRNSPPQLRRSGRDINENIAEPHLVERKGWCWLTTDYSIEQHHF